MGRKFTKIDEAFVCENCGKQINPLGYTCRRPLQLLFTFKTCRYKSR